MSAAHTSGPWRALQINGARYWTVVNKFGGRVCDCDTKERAEEIARDHNAAPAMYEALDSLLSLGASEGFGQWEEWEEVKAARAALAAAEGKS